jgi:tRNA-uridine 2-sulfurtransferase
MSIKKAGNKARKRVLVGLSGGVDSAVAACLLKREGYEVTGVHMRYWAEGGGDGAGKKPENKCCTVDGMTRAIFVARKIGIPLLVLNLKREFKREVVDFFIKESKKTLTPNPCVQCNRKIKFGLFFEKMKELGADFIATGHYARIVKTAGGEYRLYAAKDRLKDQSYFLYVLTAEKLESVLFPLGCMLKSEVRRLAVEFGMDEINEQKESQDLCFLPGKTAESFLRGQMGKAASPGPIMTAGGICLGTHCGLPFYTIGQRKGLGIGGIKDMPGQKENPWYVTGYEKSGNALIVGHEKDLYVQKIRVRDLTFVNGLPKAKEIKISAKIRYGTRAQPALLKVSGRSRKPASAKKPEAEMIFKTPQRAATPGQSVVFYRGARVLGGGIIAQ